MNVKLVDDCVIAISTKNRAIYVIILQYSACELISEDRNDLMRSFLYYFSPLMRQCLALAIHRNVKSVDDCLSAISTKNRAIYVIILPYSACELIQ